MPARFRLAVLVEDLGVGTPAQQLLDRFLIGYPHDGTFHRPALASLMIVGGDGADRDRRVADHGLAVAPTIEAAVAEADAVLICPRGTGHLPAEALLEKTLGVARAGATVFVHGLLARTTAGATRLRDLALQRKVGLMAGSYLGTTWRLPAIALPAFAHVAEALVIVPGPVREAAFLGVDALLPLVAQRAAGRGTDRGETGVRRVRVLEGPEVWRGQRGGLWSQTLLAAALARSDSPQGDPVTDGRTQDLLGLGLVPRLAKAPVAFIAEHRDGMRSVVLALDGVVADFNAALRLRDGMIFSTQLYRSPAVPGQHFSPLSDAIERFFVTGVPTWSTERGVLAAGLCDAFARAATRPGRPLATPELALRA